MGAGSGDGDRATGSSGTDRALARSYSVSLLFDIVGMKEGMRGRRSPFAGIGLVPSFRYSDVNAYLLLCTIYAFVSGTKIDRVVLGRRGQDQPKSLILAQNERWRQA